MRKKELDNLQKSLLAAKIENQAEVLSFLENESLSTQEILGVGFSRVGILYSDRDVSDPAVAKLAWKDDGISDNSIEVMVWNYAKSHPSISSPFSISTANDIDLYDLLVPVFRSEGDWILQAHCMPLSFHSSDKKQAKIREHLAKFGISDTAVNLGFYNNKIVCFDYCRISPQLYSKANKLNQRK